MQAQTQVGRYGHAHARGQAHAHPDAHAHAHADVDAELPGAHSHAVWQRHHHGAADASVLAYQAPGEDLGAQGGAASLLMRVLSVPLGGLRLGTGAALDRAWPRAGAARFSSWVASPPLQPPRG